MAKWQNRSLVSALGLALLLPAQAVRADGETNYDAAYCGGPHGSPAPRFSTLLDLPLLFSNILVYTLNPAMLYGPHDPWTNWYEESDMRKSLAKLATMRELLDKSNLWDTYAGWAPTVHACPADAATVRQIDGTCNDLNAPYMGSAGVRFGRNMDPTKAAAQVDAKLMSPNPRDVSRALFTRDEFKPVPFLNMFAASWIQFMVHDWFAHENSSLDFWQVPMSPDDPLYRAGQRESLLVPKTAADPTRRASESALGPTYPNQVTHWWDGSQMYGSDAATSRRLRTFSGGHLTIDASGLLPVAGDGFEDTGFRHNWWLGLALMHNLFAREHNAVADMLHAAYPAMTDQQLYDKARLIVAAEIAKIHTVEWTPAILPNPSLEVAMNANWYGLNKYLTPKVVKLPNYVPLPYANVLYGIMGGKRELHQNAATGKDVPYALTEEFVSVYRMHPLLPDFLEIHSADTGYVMETVPLEATRDANARGIEERYAMKDLLFSFGVTHPGALVLHNYPHVLQNLSIPLLGSLDMGTVDVLRDRERGVPRYNEFRRQLQLKAVPSIDALTDDLALRAQLKRVYGSDAGAIERVDLLVGTLAEAQRPTCYGFGETAFQVFTLMATRRLQADRFFTDDFRPEVYTPEGMAWIAKASMKGLLLRHYPELASTGLSSVTNAFYPWE